MQEIFENRTIPKEWAATKIVLIPKIGHLETLTQFHPISLCNTFLKIGCRDLILPNWKIPVK